MTQQTVVETGGVQEQKKSKTQELRDWLDAEIKRADLDCLVLSNSLKFPDGPSVRYKDLISNEREVKIAQDRKTLGELKKRLELLRSARELDVNIDAMESAIPWLKIEVPEPKIALMIVRGMRDDKLRFVIHLGTREVHIFRPQRDILRFRDLLNMVVHGHYALYGSAISWYFTGQVVTLKGGDVLTVDPLEKA